MQWPDDFGFTVGGNAPLIITSVSANSVAQKSGLQPGDQIIEIENYDVRKSSLEDVKEIVKLSKNYPPTLSVLSRIRSLELLYDDLYGYGLRFKGSGPVYVHAVYRCSSAYELGVRPGDMLLEVNSVQVNYANYEDVESLLRRIQSPIQIVLIPRAVKLFGDETSSSGSQMEMANKFFKVINYHVGDDVIKRANLIQALYDYAVDKNISKLSYTLLQVLETNEEKQLMEYISQYIPSQHRKKLEMIFQLDKRAARSCVLSADKNVDVKCLRPFTSLSITEGRHISSRLAKYGENKENGPRVVQIQRNPDSGSLGVILQNNKPVIVHSVNPGGPAEVAGLRDGDFILEINGRDVRSHCYRHVIDLLKNSGSFPRLLVQSGSDANSNQLRNDPSSRLSFRKPKQAKREYSLNERKGNLFREQMMLRLTREEQSTMREYLIDFLHHRDLEELFMKISNVLNNPMKVQLLHYFGHLLPESMQKEFENLAIELMDSVLRGEREKQLEVESQTTNRTTTTTYEDESFEMLVDTFGKLNHTNQEHKVNASSKTEMPFLPNDSLVDESDVNNIEKGSTLDLLLSMDKQSLKKLKTNVIKLESQSAKCGKLTNRRSKPRISPNHGTGHISIPENRNNSIVYGSDLVDHTPNNIKNMDAKTYQFGIIEGSSTNKSGERAITNGNDVIGCSQDYIVNKGNATTYQNGVIEEDQRDMLGKSPSIENFQVTKNASTQLHGCYEYLINAPNRNQLRENHPAPEIVSSTGPFFANGNFQQDFARIDTEVSNAKNPSSRISAIANYFEQGVTNQKNDKQTKQACHATSEARGSPVRPCPPVRTSSLSISQTKALMSNDVGESSKKHVDCASKYLHTSSLSNGDIITGVHLNDLPTSVPFQSRDCGNEALGLINRDEKLAKMNGDDGNLPWDDGKKPDHPFDKQITSSYYFTSESQIEETEQSIAVSKDDKKTHMDKNYKQNILRGYFKPITPFQHNVHKSQAVPQLSQTAKQSSLNFPSPRKDMNDGKPPITIISPPPPPPPPPTQANATKVSSPLQQVQTSDKIPLKRLNWEKLSSEKLENTVWTKIKPSEKIINFNELEELFSTKATPKMKKKRDLKKRERLLCSKKVLNLGILLGHLKLSINEIYEAVLNVDDKILTDAHLQTMLTCAPDINEIEQFKKLESNQLNDLSMGDEFTMKMLQIPNYCKRLKLMLFKIDFNEKVKTLLPDVESVLKACKELTESEKLREILEVVLTTGNYMNKSYNRISSAFGFKISFLPKLISTMSSDNNSTLLHVIVKNILQNKPELLALDEDLRTISRASKVSSQMISQEINLLKKGMKELEDELLISRDQQLSNDRFAKVMSQFVNEAHHSFHELLTQYAHMQNDFKELVAFFGDEYTKTTTEDFFGSFAIFLQHIETTKETLLKARQNNKRRRPTRYSLSQERLKHFKKRASLPSCLNEIDRLKRLPRAKTIDIVSLETSEEVGNEENCLRQIDGNSNGVIGEKLMLKFKVLKSSHSPSFSTDHPLRPADDRQDLNDTKTHFDVKTIDKAKSGENTDKPTKTDTNNSQKNVKASVNYGELKELSSEKPESHFPHKTVETLLRDKTREITEETIVAEQSPEAELACYPLDIEVSTTDNHTEMEKNRKLSLDEIAAKVASVPLTGSLSGNVRNNPPPLVSAWEVSVDIDMDGNMNVSQEIKPGTDSSSERRESKRPDKAQNGGTESEQLRIVNHSNERNDRPKSPKPPVSPKPKLKSSKQIEGKTLSDVAKEKSGQIKSHVKDLENSLEKRDDLQQASRAVLSKTFHAKQAPSLADLERESIDEGEESNSINNDETAEANVTTTVNIDISNQRSFSITSIEPNSSTSTQDTDQSGGNAHEEVPGKVHPKSPSYSPQIVKRGDTVKRAYDDVIKSSRALSGSPKFLDKVKKKLEEEKIRSERPKLRRKITKHEQPLYALVMKETIAEYEQQREAVEFQPTADRKVHTLTDSSEVRSINESPNFLNIMHQKLKERAPEVTEELKDIDPTHSKKKSITEPLYASVIRETLKNYELEKKEHDRVRKLGISHDETNALEGRITPNFLGMLESNLLELNLISHEGSENSEINTGLCEDEPLFAIVIKAALEDYRKKKRYKITSVTPSSNSNDTSKVSSHVNVNCQPKKLSDGEQSQSSSDISLTSEEVKQINQKYFTSVDSNKLPNEQKDGTFLESGTKPLLPKIPSPDYKASHASIDLKSAPEKHKDMHPEKREDMHPHHIDRPFWNDSNEKQGESSDSSEPGSPTRKTKGMNMKRTTDRKRPRRSSLKKKESTGKLNSVSFVKQVEVIDEVVELDEDEKVVRKDLRSESPLKGSPQAELKRKMTPYHPSMGQIDDEIFEEAEKQVAAKKLSVEEHQNIIAPAASHPEIIANKEKQKNDPECETELSSNHDSHNLEFGVNEASVTGDALINRTASFVSESATPLPKSTASKENDGQQTRKTSTELKNVTLSRNENGTFAIVNGNSNSILGEGLQIDLDSIDPNAIREISGDKFVNITLDLVTTTDENGNTTVELVANGKTPVSVKLPKLNFKTGPISPRRELPPPPVDRSLKPSSPAREVRNIEETYATVNKAGCSEIPPQIIPRESKQHTDSTVITSGKASASPDILSIDVRHGKDSLLRTIIPSPDYSPTGSPETVKRDTKSPSSNSPLDIISEESQYESVEQVMSEPASKRFTPSPLPQEKSLIKIIAVEQVPLGRLSPRDIRTPPQHDSVINSSPVFSDNSHEVIERSSRAHDENKFTFNEDILAKNFSNNNPLAPPLPDRSKKPMIKRSASPNAPPSPLPRSPNQLTYRM